MEEYEEGFTKYSSPKVEYSREIADLIVPNY